MGSTYLIKNDRYEKLADYIYKVQKKNFKYGNMDCAIFTVGAVDVQLGTKLKSKLFGKYKDLKGVANKIKEIGKGKYINAIEKICKDYKFDEVSPSYAQRGDVCIMKADGKTIMGIIGLNSNPIFISNKKGLEEYPRDVIQRAWRIK